MSEIINKDTKLEELREKVGGIAKDPDSLNHFGKPMEVPSLDGITEDEARVIWASYNHAREGAMSLGGTRAYPDAAAAKAANDKYYERLKVLKKEEEDLSEAARSVLDFLVFAHMNLYWNY